MAKIQPAPKKVYFSLPATKNTGYIDLSLAASVMNRRFYRQGINWAVANCKLMSLDTDAQSVYVSTLQDSWMVSNAWTKSFKAWQKMQYEFGLDEQPSIKPKFNDFKIFMDSPMYNDWKASIDAGNDGFQTSSTDVTGILMPANYWDTVVGVTAIYKPGEWIYSKLVTPATGGATVVDYHMTMHGPDVPGITVGLVENYAISRAVPFSPDPQENIGVSIFAQIFDEGTVQTDNVLADLDADNDEVPYEHLEYPGGATNATGVELVLLDGFSSTNNSGVIQQVNSGPFNAQCGLIRIDRIGSNAYPLVIELTLMPGEHRGYLCQEMQDV